MSSFDIGPLNSRYTSTDTISPLNPENIYHLNLSEISSFSVSFAGTSAPVQWQVLDSQKNILHQESVGAANPKTFTLSDLLAGDYYLQVESAGDDTEYTLNIDPLTGSQVDSGFFDVGETGEVSVNYLFDGGSYRGEASIFSLRDMEAYEPGSVDFIKEAARRSLSDSTEGHVVIDDDSEAAKFSAKFDWEKDFNDGKYLKEKTFGMNPGDKFGLMLVPNGTVEYLFNHPNADDDLRPLFSLATANPNDAFQIGQLADVTGDGRTFAMEDVRKDDKKQFDKDYNDLIFRVTGAKGYAIALDEVIDPSKDWRKDTKFGDELTSYVNTQPKELQFTAKPLYKAGELISFTDAKVYDDNGDIAKVSFSIKKDGSNEWSDLGAATNFTTDIDGWARFNYSTELEAGSYEVKAIARDILGQFSQETIQNFRVNAAPRELNFNIPQKPYTVGDTVSIVAGKVYDADGANETHVKLTLYKDGVEVNSEEVAIAPDAGESGWGKFTREFKDLQAGSYEVKAIALDAAGDASNEVIQTFQIAEKANSAPNKLQFSLDSNSYKLGDTVNVVNGKVYDADGEGDFREITFTLYKDGVEMGSEKVNIEPKNNGNSGWGTFNYGLSELSAGSYELKAIAIDKANNSSNQFGQKFTIEAIEAPPPPPPPPTPLNAAPQGLQFSTLPSYTVGDLVSPLDGKVKDENGVSDLARVDFQLQKDGGDWIDIIDATNFTAASEGWATFNVQWSGLEIGSYLLKAIAYDQAGAASNEFIQSFAVNPVNIAPINLEFYPTQPFYTVGDTVSLTDTKIRDGNGAKDLSKVDFWLQKEGEDWQNISDATEFTPTIEEWATFNYELSDLAAGNYRLKAIAFDKANGASNEVIQSFSVNVPVVSPLNAAPQFLKFNTQELYISDETVSLFQTKVYDANGTSDLSKVDFWLRKAGGDWTDISDATSFTPDGEGGATFNYDLSGLTGGSYQLWAIARDRAGAVSNAFSQDFSIVTEPEGTELSDRVKFAIERSRHLDNYDPDELNVTNQWLVWVTPGYSSSDMAARLGAQDLGFTQHIPNTYIWQFAPGSDPTQVAELLESTDGVEWTNPLVPLYFSPQDAPTIGKQWHLSQSYPNTPNNINTSISAAWTTSRGEGVVIGIVDGGVENEHLNLKNNYLDNLSGNFNQSPTNPEEVLFDWDDGRYPPIAKAKPGQEDGHEEERHGTAVAGIAAANGTISGAAPGANLAGLRLSNGITSNKLADALSHQRDQIHIYNNSWKLTKPLSAPALVEYELQNGAEQGRNELGNIVEQGRNSRGSILIFSGGNDRKAGQNVNDNAFANSRHTIAVAAIDHYGKQTEYSEPGAPLLVSAYSNGMGQGITTTDLTGASGYNNGKDSKNYTGDPGWNYTNDFGGTSAAAPLVSGVVAQMLSVNPNLTWRDVQQILIDTAYQNDARRDAQGNVLPGNGWTQNGAGRWVNYNYGYGAINAKAAVDEAIAWKLAGKTLEPEAEPVKKGDFDFKIPIPDDNPNWVTRTLDIDKNITIESIEVMFDATHPRRGDLEIKLISPDGTESLLATKHTNDQDDRRNYDKWVFTSVRHWGESSLGKWTLAVRDAFSTEQGTWNSWQLNIFGTEATVNVTATDANASESGDPGLLTFTRTGNTQHDLTVNYALAGTATNGADYNNLSSIVIPAGSQSVTIPITPIDDALFEKDETVVVNLAASNAYNLGNNTSGTVLIAENDIPLEPFTNINAAITMGGSSVDWGDYDNDGDLDILAGSQVYRNDNGSFTNIGAPLSNSSSGSGDWGDYDNDGDLDILLTGAGNSKVYRNDSGSFTDIGAALTGVSYSSSAWGDYDNDGDLDILLTGEDSSYNAISKIYRNDKGSFSDIGAGLTGVSLGSADWGDYDNDGDLDILLTGMTESYGFSSKVYRNDGGGFTDISASLTDVAFSSAAWGDYDSDGDLDILLTGSADISGGNNVSQVYRNDGGSFTNINASLTGVERSSAAWGDYDNDGDLDILLTGRYFDDSIQQYASKVYRNDGGSFTDINAPLTGIAFGSAAWGDYDNDNDLDIFLSGQDASASVAGVYRNNTVKSNTIPTVPTGLTSSVNGNSIALNWNPSADGQTLPNGLTYNLRVGTTPGGSDIVSPMASSDGTRKVAQMGNANQNTNWTLDYLAPGTYYWSVQSVDNAFAGSPFASEGSFTVTEARKPQLALSVPQLELPELDGESGQFIVSRRGDISIPLAVNYTIAGTATNGTDYQPLSGQVIIPAGSTTATIPVTIIGAADDKGDETVVLTLTPDLGYDLGSTNSGTMTIYGGAIPVVKISVTPL